MVRKHNSNSRGAKRNIEQITRLHYSSAINYRKQYMQLLLHENNYNQAKKYFTRNTAINQCKTMGKDIITSNKLLLFNIVKMAPHVLWHTCSLLSSWIWNVLLDAKKFLDKTVYLINYNVHHRQILILHYHSTDGNGCRFYIWATKFT